MAKSLEVYVPSYVLPKHPKLADPTDPTLLIIAGAPRLDNVTLQFGSMVVLLNILKATWKFLLVTVPSCLELLVGDLENASDGGTSTLLRAPLTTEVRLNLTQF